MSVGEQWLAFGILGSLLPALLLVRAILHILNVPVSKKQRALRN